MALNQACLGKIYPPISTEVTLDALQKYARACNDDNPRYFDADAAGGIFAPPMFAVVVTWLPVITALTDAELHADLLRLLHVAQDIEFIAPIRPGDAIASIGKIASIETHQNGETMALEVDARNPLGEPVARIVFTVFIRGRRAKAAPDEAVAQEANSDAAGDGVRGEPLVTVAQTIDPDQTVRYAEASGDLNPIHVDENVAKLAGLPGIIVHGLCTMAFSARVMVERLCGGDPIRLKRLAVRFSRPVFPGDTITTRAWPAGDRNGRRIFSYETSNSDGLAVMRAGIAEIAP
jgi:acyl dehydratase